MILLGYLVVNAAISVYFERKKMRMATVVHAIAFTILLVLELFATNNPFISGALTNVLGSQTYEMLHSAMTSSEVAALGPLMAVEMLVPFLIVLTATFAAIKIVGTITKRITAKLHTIPKHKVFSKPFTERCAAKNRMYILKCVMRC